jgi:hypothetical protein
LKENKMKNKKITELLKQMEAIEKELNEVIHQQEIQFNYQFKGKKVEFESSIKEAHKKLKIGLIHWFSTRPINLMTGPIIYSMIIPMLILDACISFYQFTCFPIYEIKLVKRRDYISFDRHHLHYLNWIEKFHCTYCAYGAGLLAYVTEIVARTEQYFCPIKHARKVKGTHARYIKFLDYGDAKNYQENLENFRKQLSKT